MQSSDTFAESTPSPKPRDASSASSPASDSADKTMVRAIRLAVRLCVAEQQDGIEALRHCARAARADGVKPEYVVRLIRAAWDEYAGQSGASEERAGKRLRLTNLALDEYFTDD
jgi:hypothetical protein